MMLQEVSNVTTASQIITSSELWMWDQYLSGKIFPHFQNCFRELERISPCYTRKLLGSCGREFARYPPLCIERTCSKGEQSKWGVQLALTVPSWEHRDQGTGAAGAAGKPPGPNSDTKGQIIQRRRQQYTPVAYLIQEEAYDEMFIITGCFIHWLVTILVLIYHICIYIYIVYYICSEHTTLYILWGFILYTLRTPKYQHRPNKL